MNLETIIETSLSGALFDSVFTDRSHQFVNRHSWDLCVTPEGHEIDEYDNDGSEYLVVHMGGHHLTSCRLRPFSVRTMLLDHFAGIFPCADPFLRQQSGFLYELTRFLRSPELTARQSVLALVEFAKGLDRFRDDRGSMGFIAVVYPGVSRFLRQNGARFLVLDVSIFDGKRIELICLTQAAATSQLLDRQHAFARGDLDVRPAPRRRPSLNRPLSKIAEAA